MYQTTVRTARDTGWRSVTELSLYKDYKEYLNFPLPFKICAGVVVLSVVLAMSLGLLIDPGFFIFFLAAVFAIIGTGLWAVDEEEGFVRPTRRFKGSENISAWEDGDVHRYNLVDVLDDILKLEEVDNFSDRQLLANEVFNLIKAYDIDGSNVGKSQLSDATRKLAKIKQKAIKQQQEIKLAGLNTETPTIDMAAEIELA